MIGSTALIDIRGPKTLESLTMVNQQLDDGFLDSLLEWYYGIAQDDQPDMCNTTRIGKWQVCVCKISDELILTGIPEGFDLDEDDIRALRGLARHFSRILQMSSAAELRGQFLRAADEALRKSLVLFFVSEKDEVVGDLSGSAVRRMMKEKASDHDTYTRRFSLGPYSLKVTCFSPEEVALGLCSMRVPEADLFVVVASSPLFAATARDSVRSIRRISKAPVLIVPGSDERLELAREIESELDLELCDSVSERPTDLLLSVLATAGYCQIHPDEARREWVIDQTVDTPIKSLQKRSEPLGHQAFFVVDRFTGDPMFSYYYEPESMVVSRAPNIVAAISAFRVQAGDPGKTSVFTTGDFSFVMIEKDDLIFTLVTGQQYDVEGLRKQFSFLPDLYFDEAPEQVRSTADPYTSSPFTLKLLATIPPEDIPGRFVPFKIRPPEWIRFTSEPVVDFLKAVWENIDGRIDMSQLIQGSGPQMTLGAIHFLKMLGAIEMRLLLEPSDRPRVTNRVGDDILKTYGNIQAVLALADGMLSVTEISLLSGVDVTVLLRVFGDLYRRRVIEVDAGPDE